MPTIHHRASRERVGTRSVPTLRVTILRQTAGAAGTRSSLRPLFSRRVKNYTKLGRIPPRERETISTVIASAAKQSIVTSCTERWIASLRSQ